MGQVFCSKKMKKFEKKPWKCSEKRYNWPHFERRYTETKMSFEKKLIYPFAVVSLLKNLEMCLSESSKSIQLNLKACWDNTLKQMKSLILAQNERWWRVLYMQVERGL
jgi:hypothetical protein